MRRSLTWIKVSSGIDRRHSRDVQFPASRICWNNASCRWVTFFLGGTAGEEMKAWNRQLWLCWTVLLRTGGTSLLEWKSSLAAVYDSQESDDAGASTLTHGSDSVR